MKYTSSNKIFNKYKKLVMLLIILMVYLIPINARAEETKEAYLKTGFDVRNVMPFDKGEFRKATEEEYNNAITNGYNIKTISTNDSPYPVYLWADDLLNAALYYTEADIIYLNPNSSHLFHRDAALSNFTSIDVSQFDTSKVVNMSFMFANNPKITTLDLSHFDTSNVFDMSYMFFQDRALASLNLSSFDTSNVMNMSYMFYQSNLSSIDVSSFNTKNVTNMSGMFQGCKSLTGLDLHNFDTSNVTSMYGMFSNTSVKTLDLSSFDTRKVTDMGSMFSDCGSLQSIDVSSFKVYNVKNMNYMFSGCSSLNEIDLSSFDTNKVEYMHGFLQGSDSLVSIDLSNFDTSKVVDMGYAFAQLTNLQTIYVSELFSTENVGDGENREYIFVGDTLLVGEKGTTYSSSHTGYDYARIDDSENGNPGYFTYKEYKPKIYYPDGTFEEVEIGYTYTFSGTYPKEDENVSKITLKYNDENDTTNYAYTTKSFIFNNWKVNDDYYENGDTRVINFDIYLEPQYVETITGVDLPTAKRTNYLFKGWYTDPVNGDLVETYNGNEDITLYAHWIDAVTSTLVQGTDFYPFVRDKDFNTFRKATLEEYNNVSSTLTDENIISTDDSDVPTYYWNQDGDFVYYSEADIIYLNEICYQMFSGSRFRTIDVSGLDSTKVTKTREMFANNDYLTSINLTNFDTSNVTDATYMFNELSAIRELDLSNFNTSKVKSAQGMFSNLDSIEELDLSSFDMSSGTDLLYMFSSMPNLITIYVSDKWDVSHYGETAYNGEMFYYVPNLTGYYGTVYNADQARWDRAHIDGGVENPGYFTHVSHKGETHTVTYPDGTVEIKKHNAIITLGDNNTETDKADDLATITFKLHNGEDDIIKHVQNVYYADGFSVDDISYSNGSNVRINEDKVIDYNYTGYPTSPEFPENPTDDRRLFLGWYTEEEDGDKVEYYEGEDDITLHAHWSEELLKLTVDGKTTLVEPGYVYTIPNGIPTKNSDYITIYLEDSYNQDNKEVKISYGNAVNYQKIKGTKYYPGDTYVVNEDTDVISNKSKDKTAIMDPYVAEPTYHDENGDYVFKGWIMANWDYADPIDVNIDIYSLTPDDVLFDNQTFLADFEQINEEEQVRLTIIDDYKKNNYTYIVPKGLELSVIDIDTDLHNSRRTYIENNINDDSIEYNYEIDALISHYLINDEEVPNEEGITRTINDDTTIEVVRVLTENEYCNDHETCPSIIYTEPYSRVSFDGVDNYIYTGMYGDTDGQGRMFTLSSFKPTGDPNGSLEGTVYMHFIDGTNNIILTVDEDVSIIPKGMGVIPEAKEKEDEVVPITLVYQDNETPNGVVNMTYRHTFEGYMKQNYWRVYNPGEEYDYEEDTYFYSSYNDEWIYDDLPEIDDDHFKGWWTEPEGGERVDELEYMRGYYEDYGYDTLYAHWGEPTVEICHGKGDCEEIIKGTAVVLERPEPTVTTAHFTLDYNTEEPGYEPKNVTTTRTDTVEYFMINDERYDFGEIYVFNENADMYGVTTTVYTSDFEGYYSDNWDYGLNINGYELRGWCATTDGRYCRYYDEDEDIVQPDGLTLYATYYQSEGDTVKVTVDWNTTYDWPKGESEVLPDEKYNTIDFEVPEDYDRNIYFERNDGSGETLDGSIHVTNEFIGYRVGNDDSRRYQRHDLYTFYKDIHIQSQYEEVYQEITFPEMNEPTFKGWYTRPEGGRKISTTEDFVKYMDLYNEFHLYAQYYEGLPTDMELDTDNVLLIPGEIHQTEVTFTPEGTNDVVTYTGFDDSIISVTDGLITGLSKGTTTITVGTENTDITKEITVTVLSNELESDIYEVREKENNDTIIIGADPETTILDFKDNLINDNEYIYIYDLNDNLLSDDDIVKSGLKIKLIIDDNTLDEATIIVRGDIDGDGLIDVTDESYLMDHILEITLIDDYKFYAADLNDDHLIDVTDESYLMDYILEIRDSLNNIE